MPARIPMTQRQRAALLALPDSEAAVVRHHGLDAEDLAAIGFARTPATRLSYALQLCCLRYPGRHLRTGELLPAIMLDHIAEQVGVDAGVVADFARRAPTRYDQLAAIKARFGFTDLSRPARGIMMTWLETEAMAIVDGRILLDRLLDELRTRRIVIPGISVVERMAAEAMLRTETDLVAAVDAKLDADMRQRLDMLIDEKVHDRQSRLSWLREPEPRVASASLAEILEKVAIIHRTGISSIPVDPLHEPRLTQFAREGVRYTAQAFQQMRVSRRRVILLATLREMEATLTDAAIAMFSALMGRAHLRARKRLEQRVAISGREGRDRLMRIATVLETVSQAARAGGDIGAALRDIVPLDMLDADAAIIRRTAAPHRDDVLSEIAAEYRTFKRTGPLFLQALDFHGRAGTAALRDAMAILSNLDGDWRKPSLPTFRSVMSSGAGTAMSWSPARSTGRTGRWRLTARSPMHWPRVISGCRGQGCTGRWTCCSRRYPAQRCNRRSRSVIHTHGSISAPRSSTAPCATSPTIWPDAMLPCSLASDCDFPRN
jgi:hypothetical protein